MAEPFFDFNFVFPNVLFFGSQNDCICLENNRHVTDSSGRIVSGSYSYLDPVGSLITVTYTNGADGYKERRRVQKNYGQVSTAEVAAEALEGMRAEVLGAIDVVLGGSSTVAPSASTSALVTRVLTRLRPAVARAARASLSAAVGDAGVVDEAQVASVVDEITVELRPFIASRVDQRRAAQQVTTTTTTTTTANDLVSRIISQLRPAIISTVQREVSVRKPVTTTVVQQPVKQQQVFTTVTTTTKDEFSVDLITDLVSQLQDAIQTVVNDVIVGYQGVITDGDVLVEEIVTRLQPTIRSVISTTVRRRGLNYSAGKVDRLNTRVVEGIRPVIRQTVE